MINFEFLQRSGAPLPLLRFFSALLVAALLIVPIGASAVPTSDNGTLTVRFATFNASLNRFNAGDLVNDLSTPNNAQAQTVAEIIQRTRPDVLLINEFDFDADGLAARRFQENYLSISQNGAEPIVYSYRFVAPSNTGIPSGFNFDNRGSVGGPNDAFGFGFFPAGVDFNGRRNFDEIRFWADYISPGNRSRYIYDDQGDRGGLKPGEMFVIAGDQNSDPLDGDSIPGSIQQMLEHPLVNTKVTPSSEGAVEQAALQGGANATHRSDPAFDAADFADGAPGNLRADYVLPRKNLQIVDSAVFWPLKDDPLFRLVGLFPFPSSDHRLVWVDVRVPGVNLQ